MWKIKKFISKGDYIYALVPEHPNATKNGYVLAHRVIIMENNIHRLLNSNEVVHHKDGNKKNNNISNLELMDYKEHVKMHSLEHGHLMVKLKCPWCGEVFIRQKRNTFLSKKNKYKCTCCSNHCRGKLYREIQLHGVTPKVESAISENILSIYKEYNEKDNSEVTIL